MGYDALGIGPYDLAAGIDFIRDLGREYKIKWLSANLKTTNGKRVFPAYTLIKRGGITLAVIGLTGAVGDLGPILKDRFRIMSWKESLPRVIAEIKEKKADLIVVLSSVTRNNYQEISRAFPGIRVIIEANPQAGNIIPVTINTILKCQISPRGKYLARLDLKGTLTAPWIEDLNRKKQDLLRRLDSLNWRLNRLKKAKSAPQPQYIAALEDQKKKAEADLEDIDARARHTEAGIRWKERFIAIEPAVEDDPEVLSLVGAGKKKILALKQELSRKKNVAREGRRNILALGYTGWQTCRRCHGPQTRTWIASRHASAYDTLVRKGASADNKCLGCHVSTIKKAAAPYLLFLPPSLRQVGCEACHGPGQLHAADPKGTKPANPAPTRACAGCHTPEHDDDFNLRRDLGIIKCGKIKN